MKKILVILAIGIFLAMSATSVYAIETFITKTEVLQWNPAKAYNGYTLFTGGNMGTDPVYLIDMEGNVCHEWPTQYFWKAYLYENGTLGGRLSLRSGPSGGTLGSLDWDNNRIWEWAIPEDRPDIESVHHDEWIVFNEQLNKNTRFSLIYFTSSNEEIWAAGGDPSIDYEVVEGRGARTNAHDGIIEIDMETGEIIWEWHFMDHTIQDRNAAWPNYVGEGMTIADYPGKNDVFWWTDQSRNNDAPEGIVRDWHHCNSIDYNQELDHVAVNAKHFSEFYVVDHGATFVAGDPAASRALAAGPAGDFIYRWGNPSAYQQGDPPGYLTEGDQQMYGSHNIHWIKEGLPGEGNFFIFNNDCYDSTGRQSEALEIDPFIMDADGNTNATYVNPPDAGYAANNNSNQLVWDYSSASEQSFYARHISGVDRVANGNTVICSGTQGHLFEVTMEGEVVWEYISPGADGRLIFMDGQRGASVFRCYRYGPDYPGLTGRDLTPTGPVTDRHFDTVMQKYQGATVAGEYTGRVPYDPEYPYAPYY